MRIKIKYLVILIIFVLIVTKCKSSSHEYYLSNPTNSEIKLVLDSKEYKLKPQTFEKVKLKTGKHNLKTHKGENVNFIVYYDSTGGIINPARESYLIFSEVYGSLTTNTGAMLRESELKIGKLGFEVVADVTNRLIIDKNLYKWDYNLGEKLPESVVVSKMEKHDSKKKIFTRKEFVEYIEEVSKRKLPAEARTAILNDKITVDGKDDTYTEILKLYEDNFTVPNYNTPGLKEIVQKMVDVKNKYAKVYKAREQKKLKKEMKKLFKEMEKLNKSYVENDSGKNVYYYPYVYINQGTIIEK